MLKLLVKLTGDRRADLTKLMLNAPRELEDEYSVTSSDGNTPLHVAAKNAIRAFITISSRKGRTRPWKTVSGKRRRKF